MEGIREFAQKLRVDPPKSERWFVETATKMGFRFFAGNRRVFKKAWKDRFSVPLCGIYIPDLHNIMFRYIVEVDGSFHDREEQKEKDRKKDERYKAWGFKVYRVRAYDNEGLIQTLVELDLCRQKKLKRAPKRMKAFLRREWGLEC